MSGGEVELTFGLQALLLEAFRSVVGARRLWAARTGNQIMVAVEPAPHADWMTFEARAFEVFQTAADRCVREGLLDPTQHALSWLSDYRDVPGGKAVDLWEKA